MNSNVFVLDASAAARSILQPDSQATVRLEKLASDDKNKFISPKLFKYEFGSIVRQNTPTEDISRQLIDKCSALPIEFHDLHYSDIYEILSISWGLKQTFYDCTYLHLALAHDCLLLTCDKKFSQAASHLGHIDLWE